ncbi:MAG: cupin domain-containing protein [Rhodospirillaceae bacterium]
MAAKRDDKPVLLRRADIEAMEETKFVHPLNKAAVRHTRSLGDATGLVSLGVHLVRVKSGDQTTEYHYHHHDEEWIYILRGKGAARIDGKEYEVEAGDLLGFVAHSVPHGMRNTGIEDLVYLVGGNRRPFDVCDYPDQRKRRYRTNGKSYFLTWDQIEEP